MPFPPASFTYMIYIATGRIRFKLSVTIVVAIGGGVSSWPAGSTVAHLSVVAEIDLRLAMIRG